MAEALKKNKMLTGISLEQNEFSDEGAKFLAEALKINKTLKYINLKKNRFRAEGEESLESVQRDGLAVDIYDE